ncbi:MAG: response regulator transcription factor [Rhodothermales bacterium]
MPRTLLVADDEPAIRDLLRDFFEAEGYTVVTASDGREALAVAREAAPDLVLLDVMMPWVDGFDVVRELRREGQTPVILLTARVEEADKVKGLGLGADDYVTKPFSFHEVAARVQAVLRRSEPKGVLRGGDIALDVEAYRVTVRGEWAELTPAEFNILRALMAASGRALSRLDLLEVLGRDYDGSERTVDSHVRNLRVKVEVDPKTPAHIETVFGTGYRFAPRVGGAP